MKNAAVTILTIFSIMNAPAVRAQSAPKFEVAAIRPCDGGDLAARSTTQRSSPGRLMLPCMSVRALIERAYVNWAGGHMHVWPAQTQIAGGPAWLNSARYQIEAKPASPQKRGAMNGPMLQALLEDRFQLRLHRETKEVPAYVLTVDKGGSKLQPFREGSCTRVEFEDMPPPPEPGQPEPVLCGMSEVTEKGYKLFGTTMAYFATDFSARLDRPVIDKTGIGGLFNIYLDLPAAELYPAKSDDPAGDPPSIFEAVRTAVRKLGLRLDPAKGPGEYIVLDRVERPSPN